MSLTSRLLAVGAVLTVMQGCASCEPPPTKQLGEARIIYKVDGVERTDDHGVYDFGTISMGMTVSSKLVVQNGGLGVLVLRTFVKTSGDPAKVGAAVDDPSPVFTVAFDGETTLAPGETREFDLTYAPPVVEDELEVMHETVLAMALSNTQPGKETSIITLKGKAVSGECDLPSVLDFGAVNRGSSFDLQFAFVNPRPLDTHGYLGSVESSQADGIFVTAPDAPRGEFLIPGNRERVVTFTFKPTEAREYVANVRMRRATGCTERPVRLIGTGVDAVLQWTPATVDFGYAPPGTTVAREVTFTNLGLTPVQLTMISANEGSAPSTVFKVTEAASATELTTLTVARGARLPDGSISPGRAVVKLSFSPRVLGPRNGQLVATSSLGGQLSVPMHGVGGGPDIDVRPAVLNFGRIAFFPQASPLAFANRKLSVQNVGTRPNPPDHQANLKLGKPDGVGGYVRPYWEVTPAPGSSLDEICVGTFDPVTDACSNDLPASGAGRYDPAVGLEAGAGVLDIPVRITPNGVGMREFEVKIFSNDPDEPVTTVTISAKAVTAEPCDVEISPIALAFGIVTPPSVRDLGFSIRNRRVGPNEMCLLSNLQLEPESGTPAGFPAPVFSLPGGPIDELELMPGETRQFLVRAWPQGMLPPVPMQVVGRVSFNLADPVAPSRSIALTATIANSCLTIAPSSLDFGTVQRDCSSSTREFQIYNSCSTPVKIDSSAMASAAGEPPGGPNCSGGAPCPEFFVVSGIPNGTLVAPSSSAPLTFSLKYRPINLGPDSGAFVLSVTQAGQPLDYVVPLQGNGDAQGLNTDTFRQDLRPRADILLVIDDSGSMGTKQDELATNMASFLQYASANLVDFQIGVTNTELSGPTSALAGTLHSTAAGNKILRPSTPNLETEFAELVKVGTSGGTESCMHPATVALTAPYITDPTRNAGFLRPDAVLAVVCITDARDQAPQAPAFYLNQLLNIRGAQRLNEFTYNVIGPFLPTAPPNCSYDGPSDDGRHEFMVTQTNGVMEEICTPDWQSALARIGRGAFGYRTSFPLRSRPDLSTPIQVAIDGIPLPEMDPDPNLNSVIWQYDPVNNTINFQPLYVPEPGKTLTVTYVTACVP